MSARTFAEEFWDLYQSRCRPAIEGACRAHLRRTGTTPDADADAIAAGSRRSDRATRARPR